MQDHVAKLFYSTPNNFRSISSMLQWPISNEKQTFFYKIKEKVRLGKACSVRPGSDIKIILRVKNTIFSVILYYFYVILPLNVLQMTLQKVKSLEK